jgi:sucrose phosphorylase
VRQTGRNRTINREKCQLDELQNELADENSLRAKVFSRYCQLLKARSSSPAFHPHGTQKIVDLHPSIFAVERISPDKNSRMLCLHNVSAEKVVIKTEHATALPITLEPYQILWITQ